MRQPVSFKLHDEILIGLDLIAVEIGSYRKIGTTQKPNRTAAINFLVQKELREMKKNYSEKNSQKRKK